MILLNERLTCPVCGVWAVHNIETPDTRRCCMCASVFVVPTERPKQ